MSGDYRRCRGRYGRPLAVVLCFIGAAAIGGCAEFKNAIGITHDAPDEFAVESRAPLTMPPEFNLRPPEPGAPRPQEAPADKLARAALEEAGPGKPGQQAPSFALHAPQESGATVNPEAQVDSGSLAAKLLDHDDTAAGAAVDKRETTPLKGVY